MQLGGTAVEWDDIRAHCWGCGVRVYQPFPNVRGAMQHLPLQSAHAMVGAKKTAANAIVRFAAVAALVIQFVAFERLVLEASSSNRFILYEFQRNLRGGESRQDVERRIASLPKSKISTASHGDLINIEASTGFFNEGCQIILKFSNGLLVASRVRGTSSPNVRLADAPPDIAWQR